MSTPTLTNHIARPASRPGKTDTCRFDSGDFALMFVSPVLAHMIGRVGALRVVAIRHLLDHNRCVRSVLA